MKISFLHGTPIQRLLRFPIRFRKEMRLKNWLRVVLFIPSGIVNSLLSIPDVFFKSQEPKDIVFIVGHFRSGTTHLHNMLTSSSDFIAPSTYEAAMPFHFLFTQYWLKPIISLIMPNERPFDSMKMDVDSPQEDELALATACATTPILAATYPFDSDYFKNGISLTDLEKKEQADWIRFHKRFIGKVGRRASREAGIILKSPTHTSRIPFLLKLYPNAKFIHLHRHPEKVIRSSLNLYATWYEMQSFGDVNELKAKTFENLIQTYARYEKDWKADQHLIPKENRLDISFTEVSANPIKVVEMVFDTFKLNSYSKQRLVEYLNTVKDFKRGSYPDLSKEMVEQASTLLKEYLDDYKYKF